MVETLPFNAGDMGSVSGQEAKIPHVLLPKHQNINNRSNIVTNSIKTLKMVHIQKKSILKKVLKNSLIFPYRVSVNINTYPMSSPLLH